MTQVHSCGRSRPLRLGAVILADIFAAAEVKRPGAPPISRAMGARRSGGVTLERAVVALDERFEEWCRIVERFNAGGCRDDALAALAQAAGIAIEASRLERTPELATHMNARISELLERIRAH